MDKYKNRALFQKRPNNLFTISLPKDTFTNTHSHIELLSKETYSLFTVSLPKNTFTNRAVLLTRTCAMQHTATHSQVELFSKKDLQ